MKRKFVNAIIVMCAGLCLPCVGIAAISGWGWFSGYAPPEQVDIVVTRPEVVSTGEEFLFVFEIENLADQPQTLDSLDFENILLDGMNILRSDPPYESKDQYDDFQSYDFNRNISSHETLVVKIFAKGVAPGEYPGWIDICINTPGSCVTYSVQLFVKE